MAVKIIDAKLKFRYPLRKLKDPTTITIHHDNDKNLNDTNISNNESVHRYHKSLGWSGNGYNFGVYADGEIFSLRGMNRGAHCKGANHYSIGICINGDFHGSDAMTPTIQQMQSTADLIKYLMREYPTIETIKLHKDMPKAKTVCPGNKFPILQLLALVNKDEQRQYVRALKLQSPYMRGSDVVELQIQLNALGFKCGAVDSIFGKKTKGAVVAYQKRLYPYNGIVNLELWGRLFDKT